MSELYDAVEATTLHLWDEGLVRPEHLGREVTLAVLDSLGPAITAKALRDAADTIDPLVSPEATFIDATAAYWLRFRADEIYKEHA